MDDGQLRDLISIIRGMVEINRDLRALAMCGSRARGNPRPDSDLDMLILAKAPVKWRENQCWVNRLPFGQARLTYHSHTIATYGVAWSAHIRLAPGAELELTFASLNWACVTPLDPGTRHVVSDAFTILVDKDKRLARLAGFCANLPQSD